MSEFATSHEFSPAAAALKRELSQIILWNERESPRSKQQSIGPSELGDPCDRRLAYRIAGAPAVNLGADPWPAIVGTSVHDWLEKAVNRYQSQVEDLGYMTELRVYPDPMVRGRSDVFNVRTGTVVDHKTTGTNGMRKVRKGQIPQGYRVQIQIYGLGHRRAGREVKDVALIFYPRSGWLDDAYVWVEPYDEQVALDALARMHAIAERLLDLDIENNPKAYQLIDASPGDSCVWCPAYNKNLIDIDVAASDKGCPGR